MGKIVQSTRTRQEGRQWQLRALETPQWYRQDD